MADLRKFTKFVQLVKVDEAKREVGGIVTAEVEDKDGEVCHYASTKSYYEAWSEEMLKASDGKNCGNLREMHGLSAAGVGKVIEFRDAEKEIWMTFKVVDDDAWVKVQEGVYTGFSQGGEYISMWSQEGLKWYTASPSEVSLVDNPCLGIAHFDFIRSDGAKEVRKFKQKEKEAMATTAVTVPDEAQIRKIFAEELTKAEEKTRAATAKVAADQTLKKFCAEGSMAIIEKQAQKLGLKIEKTATGTQIQLKKGMYEIGMMAGMLSDLCYLRINQTYEREWEKDSSKIPDELQANLESLAETFLAMAREETAELVESAAEAGKPEGGELAMATQNGDLLKAAQKSLAGHLKKMADCVTDHHEAVSKAHSEHFGKMKKLHKDHSDAMHGHIEKMHKLLGAEEDDEFADSKSGVNEPETIDVAAGGAPNLQHAAGAGLSEDAVNKLFDARLTKLRSEVEDEIIGNVVRALQDSAEPGTAVPAAPAVAQVTVAQVVKGVGDRGAVARGPVVRVVPITKAQDDELSVAQPAPVDEKIDMEKVRKGDREEVLKFMKNVKPSPLPVTLSEVVGRVGSGR